MYVAQQGNVALGLHIGCATLAQPGGGGVPQESKSAAKTASGRGATVGARAAAGYTSTHRT